MMMGLMLDDDGGDGVGTSGKVVKGYLWGCQVAVKTLTTKHLSDIDLELFQREVEIMRYLIRW